MTQMLPWLANEAVLKPDCWRKPSNLFYWGSTCLILADDFDFEQRFALNSVAVFSRR
jgi:hypothetical protein